ncbi:ATP-grasp domain-containing protein [Larkinella ripae]
MRTVYIPIHHRDGQITNRNIYCAFEGFSKMGYDIEFYHNIPPVKDPESIVCDTVGVILNHWRALGVTPPDVIDYPDSLRSYLGRRLRITSYGEIEDKVFSGDHSPVFIKPQNTHKLFTGFVATDVRSLLNANGAGRDTQIWVSDTMLFVAEYRVFILNGKILNVSLYNGDLSYLPNIAAIRQMVKSYEDAPLAYSIDVGITPSLYQYLVEVNDAYALGNYGLDSFLYAQMIQARWDEVVKKVMA